MRATLIFACVAALTTVAASAAPLDTAFTYQGRLMLDGEPYNGSAALRFRLWDSVVGGAPVSGTLEFAGFGAVDVENGIFTVELDFAPTILDGSDVFLEIQAGVNLATIQTLTPRQRLAPTPYSVQTRGLYVDDELNVGVNTTAPQAELHVDGVIRGSGASEIQLFNNADPEPTVLIEGDFGDHARMLLRDANGAERISAWTNNGYIRMRAPDGEIRAEWGAGSLSQNGAYFTLRNGIGWPTVILDGDSNEGSDIGGTIEVLDGNSSNNRTTIALDGTNAAVEVFETDVLVGRLAAQSYGGRLDTYDEAGARTAIIGSANSAGGYLQLNRGGTDSAGALLDGDSSGTGRLTLRNSSGQTTADLNAGSATEAGSLTLRNSSNQVAFSLDGATQTLQMYSGGQEAARISASGSGGGGGLNLFNSLGAPTVEIDSDENDHATVRLFRDDSDSAMISLFSAETASQGASIHLHNAAGVRTIELDADFSGNGRVITDELQITGGSDLSEQFDVTSKSGAVEPGMVVCIDPERPGELVVSGGAYDRRVAGIISGAGGIRPGLYMAQEGSEADGKYPVALTGRVYCYVDATYGAIEPGDLLTTAPTPGHAMKVTDYDAAQGAIIGKAMTRLADGERGLVLVLVNLQ